MSQTRIAVLQSILLVVALSMMATPAVAQATSHPDAVGNAVSDNVEADPLGGGGDRLAGETINLYVGDGGGAERAFSFEVTEDEQIENLERGAREDATVEMHTDESTFERIAHAPHPEQRFQTAVDNGAVETSNVDAGKDAEWDVFSGVEELARSLGLS